MSMYDLEVKISADSSSLQKSFKDTEKSTEAVEDKVKELDSTLNDETAAGAFSEAVEEAAASAAAALNDVREAATATAAAVNDAADTSSGSTAPASKALSDSVSEQAEAVEELNEALEDTDDKLDSISDTTDDLLPESKKSVNETKKEVNGLNETLDDTSKEADKAEKSVRKIAGAAAAVAIARKAAQELFECFKAYSDYEGAVIRVSDIFADSADTVENFADRNAKALGMSRTAAYQYASTFGNLFREITADTEQNSRVTIAMLNASAVIASKTGRTVSDVMERIRSGLLGNTEAIEDLGIFVNVAMIQTTEAFKKMADGRTWEQLNYQEQQQVRTLAILEQAHKQFGTEVSQNTAMSMSAYQAAVEDLKVSLGQLASGALTPLIQLLTYFARAASGCAAWFNSLNSTSKAYLKVALILAAAIPTVALATKGLALAQAGLHAVQALLIPQTLTYASALKALLGWLALAAAALAILHNIFGKKKDTENAADTVDNYSDSLSETQKKAQNAANSIDDMSEATKKLTDEVQRSLAGFDELNRLGGTNTNLIGVDNESIEKAAAAMEAFDDMNYDIDFDTNAESVSDRIKRSLRGMWSDIKQGYKDWTNWWHGLGEDMYTGIHDGDWEPLLTRLNDKVEALFGEDWTSFWEEAGENMYTGINDGDWTPLLSQFNGIVRKIFGSSWTNWWEEVGLNMWIGIHNGNWEPLLSQWNRLVRAVFGNQWTSFWEQMGEDMYTGIKEGDWEPLLRSMNNVVRLLFGSSWTDFWEDRGEKLYDSFHEPIEKIIEMFEKLYEAADKVTDFLDIEGKAADKITGGGIGTTALKMVTGNFGGAFKDIIGGGISLPFGANGAYITEPTALVAGEAGKEVLLPIENNTSWMDTLAAKIAALMPSGSGNPGGYAPIILDGREVGRFCLKAVDDDRKRKGG